MKCPLCEVKIIGRDCPSCGKTMIDSCPECGGKFLPCDKYCRFCGRELRFINFTNHGILRRPRRVEVHQYEHPSDRKARKVMEGLWPVKVATRYAIEKLSQPGLHGSLLGSAVMVSEKQFPRIKHAADLCLEFLDIDKVSVFISKSTDLASSSHGVGGLNFIVLTSGLVKNLDYDELLFAIGRELGHIKSEHILNLSVIAMLQQGVGLVPMFGPSLKNLLSLVLLPWRRSCELSADRAGLICCQSIQTATKALTKMVLGSRELFEKVDLDEFLRQYHDLQDNETAWSEYMQVNPFVLTRIRTLQDFYDSPDWQRLMDGAYHPLLPVFDCPHCNGKTPLKDFESPLALLKCGNCDRDLPVTEIYCPHCGVAAPPPGGDAGLASFECPSCKRPYFMNHQGGFAELLNKSLPADSAYGLLELPFNATADDVASAYVKVMSDTKDVRRKIAVDRAYRTLVNFRRRRRYDASIVRLLFERLLDERTPGTAVDCKCCGVRCSTPYCGECGSPAAKAAGPGRASGGRIAAERLAFERALSSDSAFGDGLVFFDEGPFGPVFQSGTRKFFTCFFDKDLLTATAVEKLLLACNRSCETAAGRNRLHAGVTIVVFVYGEIDEGLLVDMVEKVFAGGSASSRDVELMIFQRDGEKLLPAAARPPFDDRHGPVPRDFDTLARCLAGGSGAAGA